jgi:hypothetical protein
MEWLLEIVADFADAEMMKARLQMETKVRILFFCSKT